MHFTGYYFDWNKKRLQKIISFYGQNYFINKKILDLGCGHADISGALHRLGADITAIDARQEHLNKAVKKYPGIKTIKHDLDHVLKISDSKFDLILDLGIICHLKNYEQHIKNICELSDNIVIETAVCDYDDNKYFEIYENKYTYDSSYNGIARIPSSKSIENILTDCGMSFERIDCESLNSDKYKYNWFENNDGFNPQYRRLWFCKKEKNILKKDVVEPNLKDVNMDKSFKPKIAICISGYLRTFNDTFKSLERHILSKYSCDVFIHTWENTFDDQKSSLNKVDENYINSLFNPKKIIIEKNKNFNITPIMHKQNFDNRNINNLLSMFYKIKECNNIKNEYSKSKNINYDIIIRYRSDILIREDLLISEIDNNTLFFPEFGNFGGICDQFAFGKSEAMNKYCSLFDKIENYLYDGISLNPEKLLLHHIKNQNINVDRFSTKFVLKRKNNIFQDNESLEKKFGFIK